MTERKPKIRKVDPDKVIKGFSIFSPVYKETAAATVVLYLYMQLTEKHTPEDWQKLEKGELTPAQRALHENPLLMPLLLELRTLFQLSSYNTMFNAYKDGNITPELQKILLRVPSVGGHDNGDGGFYSETMEAISGDIKRYEQAVVKAVESGELDFSPYNKTGEKDKLWFLLYRLAPNPVPGYFGSIENWGRTTIGTKTILESEHAKVKANIKTKVTDALQNGVSPAAVYALADGIKKAYDENKKAGRLNIWNGLYRHGTEFETGFVVDVVEKKIFDLRPYTNELLELLEPGFEPLKEFYYALRRYVKDYETANREPAQDENDGEKSNNILPDDPFLMLKNSPESNAITSASGGIAAVTVQQQLFTDDDEKKDIEKWKYETTVPVKTGEIIIKVSETPRGRALNGGTEKLRILCDTLHTYSGQMNFTIPIDGYMELNKRDNDEPASPESKRKFKRKMLANLATLRNTTFEAKVAGAAAPGEIGIIRNYLPLPGNKILIEMEPRYCDALKTRRAGVMQLTRAVYRLDERNPHLIPILRKLSYNRTMHSNVNLNGIRAHRISIKSLYEYDRSFPALKTLIRTRQYKKDVITPLINAINILNQQKYIDAVFVDNDDIEHTPEELERVLFTEFIDPQKWLLRYELLNPDTGEPFKDDPAQLQKAMERKAEREEQKTLKKAKAIVARANRKKREAKKKKEQQ